MFNKICVSFIERDKCVIQRFEIYTDRGYTRSPNMDYISIKNIVRICVAINLISITKRAVSVFQIWSDCVFQIGPGSVLPDVGRMRRFITLLIGALFELAKNGCGPYPGCENFIFRILQSWRICSHTKHSSFTVAWELDCSS